MLTGQNPLNGFGSGCTIWEPLADCLGANSAGDFMFELKGYSAKK